MLPTKPALVVLPFTATLAGTGASLTLEQTLLLLRSPQREFVRIGRSHPGGADAIDWTIFRRTPHAPTLWAFLIFAMSISNCR